METKEIQVIKNQKFSKERALYNLKNALVEDCAFISDIGESPLKECRTTRIKDSAFSMRYPVWHAKNYTLTDCKMDELTRAALWYTKNGKIENCTLGGIKALRECKNTSLSGCEIDSPEFGWRCAGITMKDCKARSEYFLFECKNISLKGVELDGKYSFQYVKGGGIENCNFKTKDAFWHSENLTVKNSVLEGEYLGWYSKRLTLINCLIKGTQPLCYCKNLTLINCRTQECDLAFEYSDVQATITGGIVSVKNPKSGKIVADSIGEIIRGDCATKCNAEIVILKQ